MFGAQMVKNEEKNYVTSEARFVWIDTEENV